jgi:hypothetical protein
MKAIRRRQMVAATNISGFPPQVTFRRFNKDVCRVFGKRFFYAPIFESHWFH